MDKDGINALSQITEGINLVEKKGEDQNYLPITLTAKGKKKPFFVGDPGLYDTGQTTQWPIVMSKVLFVSQGGGLKPFNPHTQGEDPRGKWFPHGTSGGIYCPYLNTWVTQTATW